MDFCELEKQDISPRGMKRKHSQTDDQKLDTVEHKDQEEEGAEKGDIEVADQLTAITDNILQFISVEFQEKAQDAAPEETEEVEKETNPKILPDDNPKDNLPNVNKKNGKEVQEEVPKQEKPVESNNNMFNPGIMATPMVPTLIPQQFYEDMKRCLCNEKLTEIDYFFMSLTKQIQQEKLSTREFLNIQIAIINAVASKLSQYVNAKEVTRKTINNSPEITSHTTNANLPHSGYSSLPDLTQDDLLLIEDVTHPVRLPTDLIIQKFKLKIKRGDLWSLVDKGNVNVNVINFYLRLLADRSTRTTCLPSVFTMDTNFVDNLHRGYKYVKHITGKEDIFSYDIILVPVPVKLGKRTQWCMAIIHMINRTICYYDPMGRANEGILDALRLYLNLESIERKLRPFNFTGWTKECMGYQEKIKTCSGNCTVLSCMIAEYITRGRDITFSHEDAAYFRQKMIVEIAKGEVHM